MIEITDFQSKSKVDSILKHVPWEYDHFVPPIVRLSQSSPRPHCTCDCMIRTCDCSGASVTRPLNSRIHISLQTDCGAHWDSSLLRPLRAVRRPPSPRRACPSMPYRPDRRGILFFAALVFGVLLPLLSHFGMFGRRNRTSLPQVISRKLAEDRALLEGDNADWYRVDEARLPPEFAQKFVILSADEATRAFIENSVDRSDDILLQLWHNLAKSVMKLFYYTQTDINGYLGRGSMFVLSRPQFQLLADKAGVRLDTDVKVDRMIDLGAGDGCPTQSFVPFFSEVFATEASPAMRRALEAKGVGVLDIENWHEGRKFDLVACLNLLDRCAEPLSVLGQIRSALKPETGLVVVAVVLPFKPYVEFDSDDHNPLQKLDIGGEGFEEQASSAARVFEAEGFEVLSWSRVPYLCEGDLAKSVYSLDDSVFLLKLKS